MVEVILHLSFPLPRCAKLSAKINNHKTCAKQNIDENLWYDRKRDRDMFFWKTE